MTCQEFVEFIASYLEGGTPEPERKIFESHVRMCPPCLAYLDSYKETIALGRSACADPEGSVPEDVPEDLVRAVLAARRERA
jgi:anti-sigma factor RsiW